MADNRYSCFGTGNAQKETFGIETGRILDACRDRDCFEDVRVFLTCVGDELVARTGNVRAKGAEIVGANIAVDPIRFNSGFYTVLIRFYVKCKFEICVPLGQSQEIEGIAVLEKRVVLFGGESNVSTFRSSVENSFCSMPEPVCCRHNRPEAVIEVVEPVVLGARIVEKKQNCHCCCSCCDLPSAVTDCLCGSVNTSNDDPDRYLVISLGLFSVIRLVREGQLLIDAGEYCLPEKECCAPDDEDPCCSFRQMPFPAGEFCPNTIPPTPQIPPHKHNKCCGS